MEKIEMKEIVDGLVRLWVKSKEPQRVLAERLGISLFYLNSIMNGRLVIRGKNTRRKFVMMIRELENQ